MLASSVKTRSRKNNHVTAGINIVATNAPSDETRVIRIIPAQIAINVPPTNQDKPSNAPIAVATPLPPLKLKNIGQICPSNADSIMPPMAQFAKPKCTANIVGRKPLQPSPNIVMIAGALPPIRKTFVAPGFFEPWLRGSGNPHNLQTITALDKEPIR